MKIRPIRLDEAGEASRIIFTNYKNKKYQRSSKLEIEAMFKNYVYKPKYMVAEENGGITGFAGYIVSWMDYNIYQIFWVNVRPEYQKKGIGTALVNKIIQNVKKKKNVSLILLSTNKPKFYEKFGFATLMEIKKDSYLMALNLNKK